MPKLHLLFALPVIGIFGWFSESSRAEEAWVLRSGRTQVFLDFHALDEVGLEASAAGPNQAIDLASAVDLQTADSSFAMRTDGGVLAEYGGTITHRTSIVLSSFEVSVRLSGVAMQLHGNDDSAQLTVPFHADDSKAAALVGREFKIGFDGIGRQVFAEVAYLEVSPDLAARLGRPDLAGFSIGSLRMQAALDWIGGDRPHEDGAQGGVAGGNNGTDCWNPGEPFVGPDVIVGVLLDVGNYAAAGGIEAFSVGTVSCNVGSQNLQWIASTNQHPVIGQSMYRLKNGRFEHIGQSWLKHGFFALTDNDCGCGCSGQGGSVLGVGCADPYCAGLNGDQPGLGPKNQVNAHTGFFIYPHDESTGNSIYKRLQVRISDLDPLQNGGGDYFVEGQYVSPDDALAGNQDNNASHRRITITGGGNAWSASLSGTTQREQPAIRAWKNLDPSVQEVDVRVPNEGLMILASKVTDIGNGMWRYEYALHNLNSDRSAGSFSVPMADGVTVTNVGFHDVDYHSGEPYMLADWSPSTAGGSLTWATDPYATNPNANALRWGTLYNFRFVADSEPTDGAITIGLFKPGTPSSIDVPAPVPALALALAASFPPNGAIDARQPSNIDGANPTGLQQIGLTFNGYALNLLPDDFEVAHEGSPDLPPSVIALIPVTKDTVTALLSSPIRVGTWTTITHTASGLSTRIGYLPADANGDGTSSPVDILALIDSLNGVGTPLSIWSTDINRSGIAEPSDILRLIDLLNGAGEFTAYNGVSLP